MLHSQTCLCVQKLQQQQPFQQFATFTFPHDVIRFPQKIKLSIFSLFPILAIFSNFVTWEIENKTQNAKFCGESKLHYEQRKSRI